MCVSEDWLAPHRPAPCFLGVLREPIRRALGAGAAVQVGAVPEVNPYGVEDFQNSTQGPVGPPNDEQDVLGRNASVSTRLPKDELVAWKIRVRGSVWKT